MRKLALIIAATLTACSALDYGSEQTVPALIELSSTDSVVFVVPDTVTRGVAFDVSVRSYGGGCVTQGPTEVASAGDTLVVHPYHVVRTGRDIACTAELRHFTHTARLTFPTAGTRSVRVIGGNAEGFLISRTRDVVVR